MNRLVVLQAIVDKIGASTYLEIGVRDAGVIARLRCKRRIGVDPAFAFPRRLRLRRYVGAMGFEAFETTSDQFFADHSARTLTHGLDVAFIDGLHTCRQVLTDVENCLRYLNPRGAIVIHDCNPVTPAAAFPIKESIQEVLDVASTGDLPGWSGIWNGDVWKAIACLRATRSDLRVFTLDVDFGVGIVERGQGHRLLEMPCDRIIDADYAFLDANRDVLLDLKPPRYVFAWLEQR